MLQNATFLMPENAKTYECKNCDFICCKKSNFDKHLLTRKHQNATKCYQNATYLKQKNAKCPFCEKEFKHTSSMYRHKNICSLKNDSHNVESASENLVEYLMKENNELKNIILEVCKNMTPLQNTITNNTIQTNSHNKAFNPLLEKVITK